MSGQANLLGAGYGDSDDSDDDSNSKEKKTLGLGSYDDSDDEDVDGAPISDPKPQAGLFSSYVYYIVRAEKGVQCCLNPTTPTTAQNFAPAVRSRNGDF